MTTAIERKEKLKKKINCECVGWSVSNLKFVKDDQYVLSLPHSYQALEWMKNCEDLADPNFNKPGPIHLLIGANLAADIILPGVKKEGNYLLQNTVLGWIVTGPGSGQRSRNHVKTFISLANSTI
jgi:hypothetical protein